MKWRKAHFCDECKGYVYVDSDGFGAMFGRNTCPHCGHISEYSKFCPACFPGARRRRIAWIWGLIPWFSWEYRRGNDHNPSERLAKSIVECPICRGKGSVPLGDSTRYHIECARCGGSGVIEMVGEIK